MLIGLDLKSYVLTLYRYLRALTIESLALFHECQDSDNGGYQCNDIVKSPHFPSALTCRSLRPCGSILELYG